MESEIEFIRGEIALLRRDIESLEMLKNKAIFKEIASLDIHIKMDEERIRELIKILKEKIWEINRQCKKFYDNEVKKELDYWREISVCELAFLYVFQDEYEGAIVLIKEELERDRPSYEEPFSDIRLIEIFFNRSKRSLKNYEREVASIAYGLARGLPISTRDKNVEWLLRAAFTYAKCLNKLWKENKQNFIDNGEITEEIAKENSKLLI